MRCALTFHIVGSVPYQRPPAQLAERDHAGRDQFVRGGVIEPARNQVAGQRGFGGNRLQPAQQRQLALA